MTKKIAFLFPGQGAQYPGMMKDFANSFVIAKETFEEADHILGYNLAKLIFEGPSHELTLTKNSQVAIYVASIAVCRVVVSQFPHLIPFVCAGLSLGEYTALTIAEKISFADCLPIVQARGAYMHEACITHPGTMCVVLALTQELVEKAISGIANVWVANLNCPGQVVIAGTHQAIEKASLVLKESGAKRILPLDVSGAFHSGLMEDARRKLQPKISEAHLKESVVQLIMNAPGSFVNDLHVIREALIQQVTSPVLWEQGIRMMETAKIEAYIEMGPGTTLAGMNKRIGTAAPTLSIEKIEDLEKLEKLDEATC